MVEKKAAIDGVELIGAVERMELHPDDVLVVRSKVELRPEGKVYLEKQFRRLFPANRVLVVDGELEFHVFVAAEEMDAAGAAP